MMSVGSLVSVCVLCSIAITKNGDKTLVDGRTQFNVKSEILSLDFRVELKPSYICKCCLGKLKKRRALLSNLRDVNASLRQIYSSSSNGASSEESDTRMTTKTCSRALFESDVQPAKRVALQDGRSPERPQACGRIPLMTSTPYREQGGQGIDSPTVAFPRSHQRSHNRSIANCRSMMRRAKIKTSTRKHPFNFELNGRAKLK